MHPPRVALLYEGRLFYLALDRPEFPLLHYSVRGAALLACFSLSCSRSPLLHSSLEREKLNEAERMQALKLVRKIIDVNCSLLPNNIIHSLVSIGEHQEDNFARVAVECVCEISTRMLSSFITA